MPITVDNFNYASVAFLCLLLGISVAWIVSARFWFKGPVGNLSEEERKEMEYSNDEMNIGYIRGKDHIIEGDDTSSSLQR